MNKKTIYRIVEPDPSDWEIKEQEAPYQAERSQAPPSPEEIYYPESDGEPLAENTLHMKWIVLLYVGLKEIFQDREDVFVASDLLWYPVEGKPQIRRAPDAMVALGRPRRENEHVGCYLQWKEGNQPPHAVFEVRSPGNAETELAAKFDFYNTYDVEEYYLLDPHREAVQAWHRRGGKLQPIDDLKNWISPHVGLRFELEEGKLLRIVGPGGQPFMDPVLVKRELNRENQLLKQTNRQLEAEKERLLALIEKAGIDPNP